MFSFDQSRCAACLYDEEPHSFEVFWRGHYLGLIMKSETGWDAFAHDGEDVHEHLPSMREAAYALLSESPEVIPI